MIFANLGGHIRTAEPRLNGATCPLCAGPVVAKCGEINVWHWAHRSADCDPWAEPMSQWHLSWQEVAPKERREVSIGNHRADIITPRGVVVEVQHSHLSTEQIAEREAHYGAMVWIFDAREAADPGFARLALTQPRGHPEPTYRTFRWRHARRSIGACRQPVYLDLGGERLLLIGRMSVGDGPTQGWGHVWTRDQVASAINEPIEEAV